MARDPSKPGQKPTSRSSEDGTPEEDPSADERSEGGASPDNGGEDAGGADEGTPEAAPPGPSEAPEAEKGDERDGEGPERSAADDDSPLNRPISFDVRNLNRASLGQEPLNSGDHWAELRVFLAVAKAKSFKQAAQLLNISTATASRRVYRLQDALKVDLFVAGNHGVQLTPAGMDLAVSIARVDGMLSDILRSLGEAPSEPSGQVRIAITEGISTAMIASPLGGLSERYPKISVALQNPRNVNDLRANDADMMIALRGDDGPDVVCRRLGTLHLIPMTSKAYRAQLGEPTLDTLPDHRFVSSPSYSSTNFFWKPWTDLIAEGAVSHSCENSVTYFLLAKSGYGVALLSSFVLLDTSFKAADLGVHIRVPLYGIAMAESLNRAACRLAFDWLCEIYSPENPWFQDQLQLTCEPTAFDATFRTLFNLEGPR